MVRRALIVLCSIALAAPARADTEPVTYTVPGSRTVDQRLVIAGLIGAGVIAGGTAVWFHLDSRDAAQQVSADGDRVVGTWTPEQQTVHDRASSSGTAAIVGYSLSGLLLIGAATYAYLTIPEEEVIVLRPGTARPTIAPLPGGGAVVGTEWRW